MSPVERCGMPRYSLSRWDCVPFPEPGGPRKTTRMEVLRGQRSEVRDVARRWVAGRIPRVKKLQLGISADSGRWPQALFLQQSRVVPHHQVAINLLHQIERHAHGDQETRAAVEA